MKIKEVFGSAGYIFLGWSIYAFAVGAFAEGGIVLAVGVFLLIESV